MKWAPPNQTLPLNWVRSNPAAPLNWAPGNKASPVNWAPSNQTPQSKWVPSKMALANWAPLIQAPRVKWVPSNTAGPLNWARSNPAGPVELGAAEPGGPVELGAAEPGGPVELGAVKHGGPAELGAVKARICEKVSAGKIYDAECRKATVPRHCLENACEQFSIDVRARGFEVGLWAESLKSLGQLLGFKVSQAVGQTHPPVYLYKIFRSRCFGACRSAGGGQVLVVVPMGASWPLSAIARNMPAIRP